MPDTLPSVLPAAARGAVGPGVIGPGAVDMEAFERAPLGTEPFPHLVVRHFVPPVVLDEVIASLPDIPNGGSYPPSALRLRGAAAELVKALEGPELKAAVARRFGLELGGARTMLTLRGRTREKDGQIHTDSTAKLVTILLYLNPASADWARQDGCLRLLRSADDIEDYAVEVPPVDGTLLVFPNGPATFHGHKPFVGRRYAIQLNYMADDAKARYELRRHRISALVKRFAPGG